MPPEGGTPPALTFDCVSVAAGREPSGFAASKALTGRLAPFR